MTSPSALSKKRAAVIGRVSPTIFIAIAGTMFANTSVRAQTFTVSAITNNTPAFGNVAAASSGATQFEISTAGAVTVVSGSGANLISGTKSAATVTIRCSGSGSTCVTATAIARVFPLTTVAGRAQPVANFSVASGTAMIGSITYQPDGSISFPVTGFATGTSTRTFRIGLQLSVLGDDISTATSGTAAWGVGVANSPSIPASTSRTATAQITVRRAISLVKLANLAFGAIRPPTTGSGTVVINASTGVRTIGLAGPVLVPGLESSRARYTIAGQANTSFSISVPTTLILTNGSGGSLNAALSASSSGNQTLSSSGAFSFGVGGTLTVPASTPSGSYSGTFVATVSYN